MREYVCVKPKDISNTMFYPQTTYSRQLRVEL